ncbi:MAG: hypothetical protein R2684_07925 [Pyrinomonadaceae bacterium]
MKTIISPVFGELRCSLGLPCRSIAIASVLLVTVFNCHSQVTETEAKALVASSRCVAGADGKPPEYIRSTRNEKFEDELFDLQKKDYSHLEKAAYFFTVADNAIFISDANQVIRLVSGGYRPRLIAVGKKNRRTYELFGCINKKDSFQALIRDSRVELLSIEDASSFGYLYFQLVEDLDLVRIMYSPRMFRREVEDWFYEEYSEKEAFRNFKKWDQKVRRLAVEMPYGVKADLIGEKYVISATYLYGLINECPELRKQKLVVNKEGEIESSEILTLIERCDG